MWRWYLSGKRKKEKLAAQFLAVGMEMVKQIEVTIPVMATDLGLKPKDLFYAWDEREIAQEGDFAQGRWSYFFHGLECDLISPEGVILRVDFGPGGRFDTFTPWGVLQYLKSNDSISDQYREIKKLLFIHKKPESDLFRAQQALHLVFDWITERGWVVHADSALLAIRLQHSFISPEGYHVVEYPEPVSKQKLADLSVCDRYVFSSKGVQLLERLKFI